jgi:hypothetical protein
VQSRISRLEARATPALALLNKDPAFRAESGLGVNSELFLGVLSSCSTADVGAARAEIVGGAIDPVGEGVHVYIQGGYSISR